MRRLLDPQLATSYPSAILARERAIVVNLEFIKCIIAMGGLWLPSTKRLVTTRQDPLLLHLGPNLLQFVLHRVSTQICFLCWGSLWSSPLRITMPPHLPPSSTADNIYITNLDDQNTQAFVEELQRRLRAAAAATAAAANGPGGLFVSQSVANLAGAVAGGGGGGSDGEGVPLNSISAAHEELPFELRTLEIGLDTVSQYLERLTGDLEAAAHPALDALTGKVSDEAHTTAPGALETFIGSLAACLRACSGVAPAIRHSIAISCTHAS
jgi:hypothetical protein